VADVAAEIVKLPASYATKQIVETTSKSLSSSVKNAALLEKTVEGTKKSITAVTKSVEELGTQIASTTTKNTATLQTVSKWGTISKGLGVLGIVFDAYDIYTNVRTLNEQGEMEKVAEELQKNEIFNLKNRKGWDVASGVRAFESQLIDFKEILDNCNQKARIH